MGIKPEEVTGSASALAFLFSGGHAMQVSTKRTRAQRIEHRAALAESWSRGVMARVSHPVAALRAAFIAKFSALKMAGPSWQAFRRREQRRPVVFAERPTLKAVVRRVLKNRARETVLDRRAAKRAVRKAGYRWKSAARLLKGV